MIALIVGGAYIYHTKYSATAREAREICVAHNSPRWPEVVKKYGLDETRAYCEVASHLQVTIREGGAIHVSGNVDNGLEKPWQGVAKISIMNKGINLNKREIDIATLQPGEQRSYDEVIGNAGTNGTLLYNINIYAR